MFNIFFKEIAIKKGGLKDIKGVITTILLILRGVLEPLAVEIVWCLAVEARPGRTVSGITP